MYSTTSAALPSGMPAPSTIPPPPSLPFFFRRRIACVDFTRLHSINLDHLIQSVDIATLQQTLDNLSFSDLTPADLPQLTPAVLVKGWRLLQLTVEYLLHVQSFLYHAHATAQYECEVLARKCVGLKEQQKQAGREKDKEIRKLRKELKHAQQQLHTLDSFSPTKPPPPPPALADGAVHACSECHAAFISASYLASHVKRRHPHSLSHDKSSRRQLEEEKEQLSITVTSESDSAADRRSRTRGTDGEEEERAKDKARLRQIELELREKRERDRQRSAHLDQLEQRYRQADEQRDMRWQQQLKQQQTSLLAHLTEQQQRQSSAQQQVVSVEWLREWQAEMQSMMESRLNDCFQREESKREARLISRLEAIEARVRDVKSGEWEAGVRRVMAEIATLKADTARLIDVRDERRKEERREAKAMDAATRESEARELDERRRREEEADALTQRALLLEQQRLELERSQDALHSHSPTLSPNRPPRYPVIDSLPFLLARYPHSPATVERIVSGVEERAAEVERRREAEGGVSDDEMPDELKGVESRVDEMVALHWREEEGQAERRVGLEERVRELELERDRLRDEQRRKEEERREEQELEDAMRTLDRQKDEIERERDELNRRTEEEERRRDEEMQAEIEREMAELKHEQLVQQERHKLAEKQRQREEQDRRDREDEQRWRAEEVAREQLRTASMTPTPPLTSVSSMARPAPPPLVMPLTRQQSSPSMPTPAFTTHVAASPLSAMGGMGGGLPAAMFSLEAKGSARSHVEEMQSAADEDDEWGWEKDEEQKQHSPLPTTAPTTQPKRPTPTTSVGADDAVSDDDALTAALFRRGGAAGSGNANRSPTTLAERKQALMDKGFGLKLQTPQQRREEEEARRRKGQGRGGELVELDSANSGSGGGGESPVLRHPVKGRAHIAGRARHGGGRGMVSAFRPSSAASNVSIVSGGSWDD